MFGLGFLWLLVRAFRVLLSISWVLVGISCLAERFVGIGGHFVFGRAFRRYWWAFRVWPSISWVLVGISCLLSISYLAEHFVGIGVHFVFGKQASPGNIMFDTPKHSAERVFW